MIEMKKENEEEETFYRKSDKRGRFLPTQGLVRFRLWFTLMGKWENTLRGGGRGKRGALIVAYPVLGVILCHQHSNTVMSIWDSREKDLALHLKRGDLLLFQWTQIFLDFMASLQWSVVVLVNIYQEELEAPCVHITWWNEPCQDFVLFFISFYFCDLSNILVHETFMSRW